MHRSQICQVPAVLIQKRSRAPAFSFCRSFRTADQLLVLFVRHPRYLRDICVQLLQIYADRVQQSGCHAVHIPQDCQQNMLRTNLRIFKKMCHFFAFPKNTLCPWRPFFRTLRLFRLRCYQLSDQFQQLLLLHVVLPQDRTCRPFLLLHKCSQKMLRTNVAVPALLCCLLSQPEHLPCIFCII